MVHSVVGTAANVAGVTQVDKLLHGDENVVCTDAGYTGVEKRSEVTTRQTSHRARLGQMTGYQQVCCHQRAC